MRVNFEKETSDTKQEIKELLCLDLNLKENIRGLHKKVFKLYSLYELDKKYKKSKAMDNIRLALDKLLECLVLNKRVEQLTIKRSIIKILGV
ncbi:hypothetical protein FCL73_02020 [Mycoplasma bovis]|nr:hypothetical protein [Mycoplasmopsis bovis]MBT1325044.1 hypothetical protein [Mycoplasmopsis bovis]MBT1330942.1 hypothetical protein [Mycoplasmopsis bovis]MBT1334871.1 hypothetical protein [Mycoplasmopsis bovis]MBT1344141.1 hypothetical protein [Mycoplasmopsis bovis]